MDLSTCVPIHMILTCTGVWFAVVQLYTYATTLYILPLCANYCLVILIASYGVSLLDIATQLSFMASPIGPGSALVYVYVYCV